MRNKRLLQLERPINMSFGLKAPDMCKHLSGIASVLAHHCGKITKLKWRRRLNPCCRAQLDQSKHVTLNVLLRSCLQNDSRLPTLEFDTDGTTHHSREYQLCMQVLAAGCKKSVPCILRRSCGSAVNACGGAGARTCAELAGVENNVTGAVVST